MLFSIKNYKSKNSNLKIYIENDDLKNMFIGYDKIGFLKFYLSNIKDIDIVSKLRIKSSEKVFIVFNLNRYYINMVDLINAKQYINVLSLNSLSKYIDYFLIFNNINKNKDNFIPKKEFDIRENYINLNYFASSGIMNSNYLHIINEMSLSDCLYSCFDKETIYSDFRLKNQIEDNKDVVYLLENLKVLVEQCFEFIFSRIKVKRLHDLTYLKNQECGLRCYYDRKAILFFNSISLVIDFYMKLNLYSLKIKDVLFISDEDINFDIDLRINVKFLFYHNVGYVCVYVIDRNLYRCFKIKNVDILNQVSNIFKSEHFLRNFKKFVLL
ncbi:MAG: hypothetical protein QXF12_02245 [Candidatus Aenigmatarchaeota archaeon]